MGMAALPIAMMAASTAVSVAGQAKQASAAKQQIGFQESQDALLLARQERNSEDELQKTLARQNAWFAASGTDPGSGSELSLANAAKARSDDALSLIASGGALTVQQRALSGSLAGSNTGVVQSLLSFGGSGTVQNSLASVWR